MNININNMQHEAIFGKPMQQLVENAIEKCLQEEDIQYNIEVNVLLVDNQQIKDLNEEYRNKKTDTDVLSFPLISAKNGKLMPGLGDFNPDDDSLMIGDIVISIPKMYKQAEEYGHSKERELAFLVTHGLFHLIGYDHETDEDRKLMFGKQEKILEEMELSVSKCLKEIKSNAEECNTKENFKSGFITVIGRPNVGKSTLLNCIIGQKISIVSHKPQTTRNAIRGILNEDDAQMIFIDTPGIHKAKNKLDEYMLNVAMGTFKEIDVILFMIEATETSIGKGDLYILEQLKLVKPKVFLIINKVDLSNSDNVLMLIEQYKQLELFEGIISLSALNEIGITEVINRVKEVLPCGPKYFPVDMIVDKSERFMVSEIVREKILKFIREEIPYGVGVEVMEFKERKNKNIIDMQINIYCEKESHKGILIGQNGVMLKKIGTLARKELEFLLDSKIFMELKVKVKADWRNSDTMLRTLGYK